MSIMLEIGSEGGRDVAGRFVAGYSGNPAGKRPGTLNRKTVLLAALREGEGEAAARVVIDKALAGDANMARFIVAQISPRPRGRTVHIEMPEDDDCNVVATFNATLRALCNGEITPDEALQVSRFLDGRRETLQAWQLEIALRQHGRIIPGDPDWTEEDDEGAAADASSDPAELLQSACISQVSAAAPVVAAAAGSAAQRAAAPLQNPCISPVKRLDQIIPASVAQRRRDAALRR
jgi:hypothetical protein